MKKTIMFFVLLLVMECLLACHNHATEKSRLVDIETQDETQVTKGMQDEFKEVMEASESGEKEPRAIVTPVLVYDDDMITLHYIGTDIEYLPSIIFSVENKTEQDICFYFDAIAIDGKTEYPAFIVEVLAGTKSEYWCDVSTIEGLNMLTANICIANSEGYTIKECKIIDVPLK